MSIVSLAFPAALLPSYSLTGANGQPLTLTPINGIVTADVRLLDALYSVGFLPAPTVGATSVRPTTALYAGMPYVDSTLNKPIWRNAANTGWIDATGSAV